MNQPSKDGKTALIVASYRKAFSCVHFLLQKGANVNNVDNQGNTVLHALMQNVHYSDINTEPVKCIKTLLDAGAKVNKLTVDGKSAPSFFLQKIRSYHPVNYRRQVLPLFSSAGERLGDTKNKNQLNLRALCRNTIREHLLDLDPHENLFVRVPRLEIPVLYMNTYCMSTLWMMRMMMRTMRMMMTMRMMIVMVIMMIIMIMMM